MSLGKRLFPASAYLSYWLNAVDEHSIHSPFLFNFYNKVLKNDEVLPAFEPIEKRRTTLLNDARLVTSKDPGAGSLIEKPGPRKVKTIARHSLSSPSVCRFIYRVVQYFKPAEVLEIGTSFGITSSYFSIAAPEASFSTMEGNAEIARIALETFAELDVPAVNLLTGDARELLPEYLMGIELDMVYLDAHHTEAATLEFFNLILDKLHRGSVVIVGDIHWSAGMEKAWKYLTANEAVSLSLDVFHAGILFFNPDLRKETLILTV